MRRQAITRLTRKPGEPIVEKDIAQAQKVSRTPVREALLRLGAECLVDTVAKSGTFERPLATVILPASEFWPAEEYHQKYYLKNKMAHGMYHFTSGRPSFKYRVWGAGSR